MTIREHWTAMNDCNHTSCNHRHQTRDAALRCAARMNKRPHPAGSLAVPVRFVPDGDSWARALCQGR